MGGNSESACDILPHRGKFHAELYHQRSDRNCERRGDIFHRSCFRLLYPVAAGISEAADEKADFRLSEGKARKPFSANLCADVSHVFKFPDRAVPGGGDSGDDVLHFHDDSAVPLRRSGWGADCIYGTDSHFRGVYRLCRRGVSDFDDQPLASSSVYRAIYCITAD